MGNYLKNMVASLDAIVMSCRSLVNIDCCCIPVGTETSRGGKTGQRGTKRSWTDPRRSYGELKPSEEINCWILSGDGPCGQTELPGSIGTESLPKCTATGGVYRERNTPTDIYHVTFSNSSTKSPSVTFHRVKIKSESAVGYMSKEGLSGDSIPCQISAPYSGSSSRRCGVRSLMRTGW